MLGELSAFDNFSGTPFEIPAMVLLLTYVGILTVIMFNLLIAVLSTAHARVSRKSDQEYKVSQGHRAWSTKKRNTNTVQHTRLIPRQKLEFREEWDFEESGVVLNL